jgi:hypothetical protein
MGGQPGKPKPPGNPPDRESPQRRPPVEEPPRPIPIPPMERPPAPMQVYPETLRRLRSCLHGLHRPRLFRCRWDRRAQFKRSSKITWCDQVRLTGK